MDPQQPIQPPPINPTPPPSLPQPHSKLPLILGILFLSIFILVGSYMVFGTKKTQTPTPPVSSPPPTAVPATDQTTNWLTYQSTSLSFSYPPTWQVKEQTIEDIPTIIISKGETDTIYNTAIYVGSPFIFSTSGQIGANASCCGKIGDFNFTIMGKSYTPDLLELEDYLEGNKPTGKKYYRFQTGIGGESDTSRPTVTTQFINLEDKNLISQILSTFKFLE